MILPFIRVALVLASTFGSDLISFKMVQIFRTYLLRFSACLSSWERCEATTTTLSCSVRSTRTITTQSIRNISSNGRDEYILTACLLYRMVSLVEYGYLSCTIGSTTSRKNCVHSLRQNTLALDSNMIFAISRYRLVGWIMGQDGGTSAWSTLRVETVKWGWEVERFMIVVCLLASRNLKV